MMALEIRVAVPGLCVALLIATATGMCFAKPADGIQNVYAFILCGDDAFGDPGGKRWRFINSADVFMTAIKAGWKVPPANIAPPLYAWENTSDEFISALTLLVSNKGADSDDVLIFYYVGHGLPSKLDPQFRGATHNIAYADVDSVLDKWPGVVVIILDACYSGSAIDHMAGGNRWILCATGANQKACDPTFATVTRFTGFVVDTITAGGSLRQVYEDGKRSEEQDLIDGSGCAVLFGAGAPVMYPETGDFTPKHGAATFSPGGGGGAGGGGGGAGGPTCEVYANPLFPAATLRVWVISVTPARGATLLVESYPAVSVTVGYELKGVPTALLVAGLGHYGRTSMNPIRPAAGPNHCGRVFVEVTIREGVGTATISGFMCVGSWFVEQYGTTWVVHVSGKATSGGLLTWCIFPEYSYSVRP